MMIVACIVSERCRGARPLPYAERDRRVRESVVALCLVAMEALNSDE